MDTDKNYEFLMGIKSSFSLDESGSSSSAEDKAVRRQVALLISSYKTSDSRKFEADVKQFLDEGTIPPTINKQDVKSDSTGSGTAIPPGVTLEKHLENLQHLIELNNVHPEPEDIAGEEIDFTNLMDFSELEKIPRKLEGFLKWRIAFQQKQANSMLKQYSEKYGYQPLFRKAIREYFTTILTTSSPNNFKCIEKFVSFSYRACYMQAGNTDETARIRFVMKVSFFYPQTVLMSRMIGLPAIKNYAYQMQYVLATAALYSTGIGICGYDKVDTPSQGLPPRVVGLCRCGGDNKPRVYLSVKTDRKYLLDRSPPCTPYYAVRGMDSRLDMKDWMSIADIQEGLMVENVDLHGDQIDFVNLMNPSVDFEAADNSLSRSHLPLSGRLIPEFNRRRNIRDMFLRQSSTQNPSPGEINQNATSMSRMTNKGRPISLDLERSHEIDERDPKRRKKEPIAGVLPTTSQKSIRGFFSPRQPRLKQSNLAKDCEAINDSVPNERKNDSGPGHRTSGISPPDASPDFEADPQTSQESTTVSAVPSRISSSQVVSRLLVISARSSAERME
ncbi:DNA lyase [Coccidioides immitis RMSCC 2394]|uniref:DNA lyase n=1 Tax=Coccidioides immitis RMSCC 2394 TaxID=404692 RepID=A0A0J6Y120_COCIT|nr:DNA lyase [Coccidioides immitis RMSCC 2394]